MILTNYTTMRADFDVSGGMKGKHGYELWPYDRVRIGGFTDLTLTKPVTVWPVVAQVDNGSPDITPGISRFTWYLEQKSDLADHQYLTIRHPLPGIDTFSSIVEIYIDYGNPWCAKFDDPPTMDQQIELFKHVYLFVQRKSSSGHFDRAIQWIDFSKHFFSQAP